MIFLPENSTHLMQPLDVAVFGPMKRRWRHLLDQWKEEGLAAGEVFATIPKKVQCLPTVGTSTGTHRTFHFLSFIQVILYRYGRYLR